MRRTLAAALTTAATFGTGALLVLGLLATGTASATDSDLVKRDEDRVDLVLVDDRDDDDTNDDTSGGGDGTGDSRSRADHTNSRFTAVSRDRDLSRGDKTRDWTKDGPRDSQRDWSANRTNDRSRNDTRR